MTESICDLLENPECRITALALENCGLGSEDVKELSQRLSKNQTMTSISLAHNEIGNIGAKFLGQVLSNNSTIISLNLSCTSHSIFFFLTFWTLFIHAT